MSAYSLQRCVIHPLHSKVGVCALCLRERLLALEEDRSHSVSADDSSTPPDLLPPLLPRHGSTSTSTSTSTSALDNKPAESVKETHSNVVPLDRPQQRLADEWIPENCTIPPPPFPTFLHHRLKLKTLTIPPPSPDRPPSATATAMAMASSQDATTGISHQKFNPNPSRFSNFVTPRRSNASELADHVNNVRLNCSTAKQPQKSPAAAAAAAAILQQQDGGLSRVDLQQEPASECSLSDQGNHRTALSSSSPLHPRSINNSSAATSTNWIASLFHRGSRKNKQSSSSSSSSSSKKNRNHGNISGLEYHIGPEKFHGNEGGPIVPCRMSVDGSGLKPSCPGHYKPKPHWADNETRGSIYSVKPHHHQSKCDTCATNASPASLGERLSTARLTFKLEQRKLVEPNPDSTWARSDGHVDVEIRRPAALFERSRSCGSSTYSIAEFPSCPSSKNVAARPKRSCGPSPAHVSIPKHTITGVGARNGKDSRLSLGSYLSSPFRKSAAATANRKQAAVHHL